MYHRFRIGEEGRLAAEYSSMSHITVHGAPHSAAGYPADNFTVSDIQSLAEGSLE